MPNNEKRINIVTLWDLEAQAQKVMTPPSLASALVVPPANGQCART